MTYQTKIEGNGGDSLRDLVTVRRLIQACLNAEDYGNVVALVQTLTKVIKTARQQELGKGELVSRAVACTFVLNMVTTCQKHLRERTSHDEETIGSALSESCNFLAAELNNERTA